MIEAGQLRRQTHEWLLTGFNIAEHDLPMVYSDPNRAVAEDSCLLMLVIEPLNREEIYPQLWEIQVNGKIFAATQDDLEQHSEMVSG